MILLFVIAKFFAYVGVCLLARRIFSLRVANELSFSLSWAFVRFGIGVISGVVILIAYNLVSEKLGAPDWLSYILSFGIIRYFEWLSVFALIKLRHSVPNSWKVHQWVLVGVAVSLLSDWVAVLTHVDQTKFFC